MQIKKGTHRVVILTGSLVIKLPKILRPFHYVKIMQVHMKKRNFNLAWIDTKFLFQIFLEGIKENWNEFRCWKELRSSFLVPTYLSFLGLLNLQKKSLGKEITKEEADKIWLELEFKTGGEIWKTDCHTLTNERNYSRFKGNGIKLLDYGSVRKFIRKWEKAFKEVLSP